MRIPDVSGGWRPVCGDKLQNVVGLLLWAHQVAGWAHEFLVGDPDEPSGDDLVGDQDELAGCLDRASQVYRAIGESWPVWSFVVYCGHHVGVGDTMAEATDNYRRVARRLASRRAVEFVKPVQVWMHPVHGWSVKPAGFASGTEEWDGCGHDIGDVYRVRPGGIHAGERLGRCEFTDGVITGSEVVE